MSRSDRRPRAARTQAPTPAITRLLMLGLAVLLAACAAAPLAPSPTPIPLVATATPRPAPTQPTPTLEAEAHPAPVPAASPTATAALGSTSLDWMLARRTVEDLLARLERGEVESVANLYLSDGALQAGLGQVLLELGDGKANLVQVEILELRQVTASNYKADVLLHWAEDGQDKTASQPMMLSLVYQRGLWLVDQISVGELRSSETTNEQQSQAPSSQRAAHAKPQAGRLVLQVSSGGPIYLIDADGSNLQRLADGLDPAWSPRGNRIAFTRWGSRGGLYLIGPDGSGEERLVDGERLKEAAWSSDGAKIAYTVNRGPGEPVEVCYAGFCFTIPGPSEARIWTLDLDSGDFLSLPLDDQVAQAPTWSPSGERIVYSGERGLAWIDLDNLETGRFQGGSAWDRSPTFSPDGRRLAFMSRVHDHWEVLVINADGSGRKQLTHSDPRGATPASSVAPAWSPDGKSLAFLSNRDGPWRIYIMAADGSGQRPMFGAQLDHLGLRYEWAAERVISWTK